MPVIKPLQFKVPDHFLTEIDDYIKKVNDTGIYPMKYKRSHLFTAAISHFIKKDLALKK